MTKVPISKTKIETKLATIRDALMELELIAKLNKTDFSKDKMKFVASEHFLRRALEAIFDISGHIISRFPYMPGKRPTTYKEIATAMGEKGIVSQEFAKNSLLKRAGTL